MDIPSSSNVTGRRKRNAVDDADDDEDPRTTPLRKVRGNKRINRADVAPAEVMKIMNNHVDDIINKKKVGSVNCFDFKSPLELYGIEALIEANASIHEMAVVLEGAQHVMSYRVDRLLTDVRQVDAALSSGDITRGTKGAEEVHINVDSRKLRKKMAVADGISGMTEFFDLMGIEDRNEDGSEGLNEEEEELIAGERRTINPKENSKDVDLFLKPGLDYEKVIHAISISRSNNFKMFLNENISSHVAADDTAFDLKDSSIDWLRNNPQYQKAIRTSNSFHSLNYFGLHSPSGRALKLHPRVVDENADDRFFPSDLTDSLAKNTHGLLENALEKKPQVLDNYLMLEVKDRPVVGRYQLSKAIKKAALPLAASDREKDLEAVAFTDRNARSTNADTTVAGASDMSILPGQGLPLSRGENDETIDVGRATPMPNQTISQMVMGDQFVPPSIDALKIEESLIGKVPLDPLDSDKLESVFEEKLRTMKSSDAMESKIWKTGIRAEEWGEDDENVMKVDTRNVVQAGIEGWIKATDAWTNYDVVKMVVNRETRMQLDEALTDDNENRALPPEVGKNFFLVKSDEYMNSYPTDRFQDMKMLGEEFDFMKMWNGEEDDDGVTVAQIQEEITRQQNRNEPEMDHIEDMDYDVGGVYDDMGFEGNLAAAAEADEIEPANNNDSTGREADILFNDQLDETTNEIRDERDIQREVERIAIGPDEVAELMTAEPVKQLVGPTAEMRDEIRNIGRADNAHWAPPDTGDQEKQAVLRKKREKKAKSKKLTVEDFVHYFREIPDDELEREMTITKGCKIADEKSTFLTEGQLYMETLGSEKKPHVAFEMGLLGNSGLFFKKSYGKIKLERTKPHKTEEDIYVDESKGSSDSDCLNWLMTFSGFRCMQNPETVEEQEEEPIPNYQPYDDYVNDIFDDDRYDPRHEQEMAASRMGPDMQRKFALATSHINQMMPAFHFNRENEYEDSDDEFDDSYDRQTIHAKNLDAAKHKKCIAEILKTDRLSMPSIQFALEQLTMNNQTIRQNNTTIRGGPSTSDDNETARPQTPSFEADKTLTSVFEYHSPRNETHDVNEIMKALIEAPDYQEDDKRAADPSKPASKYDTANTRNSKVKIQGCHTLLSLALSMPPKMGEHVRPSSIVSFLLHIANENGLQIVQDRSKRSWMSDFVVLNKSEKLPAGIKMGKIEDQTEFWKRTQDPDAIEGTSSDSNSVFTNLMSRPKAVAVRKGRGAAPRAQSPDLGAIAEEEEEMEE